MQVRLYDTATCRCLRQYTVGGKRPGAAGSVSAIAWFPGSRRFLAATPKVIEVFDAQTSGSGSSGSGLLHRVRSPHAFTYDVAVAGSDYVVTVGQDHKIGFTRCACWALLRAVAPVCQLALRGWSKSSRVRERLCVCSHLSTLSHTTPCSILPSRHPARCAPPALPHRLSDGRVQLLSETGAVSSIAVSRCGRLLAANLTDSWVHLWQLPAGLAEEEEAHLALPSDTPCSNGATTTNGSGDGVASLQHALPLHLPPQLAPGGDPLDHLPLAPLHEFRMGDARPIRFVLRWVQHWPLQRVAFVRAPPCPCCWAHCWLHIGLRAADG